MSIKFIISVLVVMIASILTYGKASLSVETLQCEYLTNPIGIDTKNPRFTWQINSNEPGILQDKYQIIVDTAYSNVIKGNGNIWSSGEVNSETIPVIYSGKKLQPFTKYYWSVRIQDKKGNWSSFSKVSSFETGMMELDNWKGDWISDTHDFNIKPAPYFRKEFQLNKKVKSARLYIAVAGLFELSLNGNKLGDQCLNPMFTRYDRRNLYLTYDITNNLNTDKNVVGVLLGNGWYNHQSIAVWYFDKAPWRARPKFCLDLRITYEDGSKEIIRSDNKWRTSLSPIVFNSIYTAEHYDARKEMPGWNEAGYDDSDWQKVLITGAPSKNIISQTLHPIRKVEKIQPKELTKLNNNTFLFDFGQNISGVIEMKILGDKGTTIKLKHAEKTDKNGYADQSNIDKHYQPMDDSDPFQTDIFILSGEKEDRFVPRFNYKGFQFVEVSSNSPLELDKGNLVAYFMHSDVPVKGTINSSNKTLNGIWRAANNSYLSNLFGYPTDCPQREKNGWTGDAHINIETALYNFDAITVYEKWMADHQDEQQLNGVLPAIIPTSGWGYHWGNGPDWTSTIAIIPWNIYLFYGDIRILENCYENIKRYVNHIYELYPSGLTDWGLGDWVPVKSKTPKEFTSSTYFYTDVVILSKAAKLLGKQKEYEIYRAMADKIKDAINNKYLNRENGIYGSGFQTELSAALYWGLVPDELIATVAENLAKRVVEDGKHIDVGLLGSKTILNALSENGYSELAWEVASKETFPSWGWWIKNGATTFYENWSLDALDDASMNHIMFGEISAWYYKALGGIFPDENIPGFKNIILKPNFVSNLNSFEAKYNGPYGTIISSWKISEGNIEYHVSVPPNSTAELHFDHKLILEGGKPITENKLVKIIKKENGQALFELKSGEYRFTMK